tara:strand:+ start:15983 stop:16585 length:603 start_codon:yes stop_codon:yes gene_type:complete
MAWKVERWLEDVFPGEDRIYEEYRLLPRRELGVVAAAVLDVALGELLSRRLIDKPKEYEEFLGLNEDGRAPCASFGARIQLGLLLGIITETDASLLRTVKNIRNKLAHRVKSDYNTSDVLPLITSLHDKFLSQSNRLIERGVLPGPQHDFTLLRPHLETTPEAGAGLLLAVLTVYQSYFHRLSDLITRVTIVFPPDTDGV